MSKEVRVCQCGAIHFFDNSILDEALEKDKVVLLICGSCGRGTIIGADRVSNFYIEAEGEPEWAFDMYSYDVHRNNDKAIVIDSESFGENHGKKSIHKVVFDNGKKVMMETGYRANHFSYEGGFSDMLYPDFIYRLSEPTMTMDKVREMTEEYNRNRHTVNMNALMRSMTDEELALLAGYRITGLDFTGTKWDRNNKGDGLM